MRNRRTVIALLLLSAFASFANTNDDLRAYQALGERQIKSVSSQTLNAFKTSSEHSLQAHETLIEEVLNAAKGAGKQKQPIQQATGAILFVSFSMPESLLLAIGAEAAELNIPVVMNGLKDNDFKKTIETFASLHQKAEKQRLNFQGISIDPVWFQQFSISKVPALVVTERPAHCEAQTVCINQPFDVVYGNASIKKGLALIAEKGTAGSAIAKKILGDGHV